MNNKRRPQTPLPTEFIEIQTKREENLSPTTITSSFERNTNPHEKTQSNATVLIQTNDDEEGFLTNTLKKHFKIDSKIKYEPLPERCSPKPQHSSFADCMEAFIVHLKSVDTDEVFDSVKTELLLNHTVVVNNESIVNLPKNLSLNNNIKYLPNDSFRVILDPTEQNSDGYINATFIPRIDSLKQISAVNFHNIDISKVQVSKRIIAQTTKKSYAESMVNSFFDMIFQMDVGLIVGLAGRYPFDINGSTSQYEIMTQFQVNEKAFTTRSLEIHDKVSNRHVNVWDTTMKPLSVEDKGEEDLIKRLVDFFMEVQNCKRRMRDLTIILF